MIIIHVVEQLQTLPRALEPRLADALAVFPVVVVVGPRQCGKSTLVRDTRIATGREYYTLDDLDVLSEARSDPDRLLARAPRTTIDEVQRAPELLLAMKRAVDRNREPGRFLVTGSADVRSMSSVADHLPGRAVYLNLEPMTHAELAGRPAASGFDALLAAKSAEEARERMTADARRQLDVLDVALRGGLPPAARLDDEAARELWFDAYVRAWLERGLAELSAVADLPDMRRTMSAVVARLGGLLNQADVARDAGLPRTTCHRYLGLLSTGFLLDALPAYAVNRTVRTIKSPKVYWRDTGLATHLLRLRTRDELRGDRAFGAVLENVVLGHLRAWSAARRIPADLHHWRTAGGREVDFVVEDGGRTIPIEVKAGAKVTSGDIAGVEAFLAAHPKSPFGIVLHGGDRVDTPGERVVAVPLSIAL